MKLKPLFYIDYDFTEGIVAIQPTPTPAPAPTPAPFSMFNPSPMDKQLPIRMDAPLYQKSSTQRLEGGIGAALSFYYKNATGVAAQFWAQVGLMPMHGTEISSVRYASTLAEAQAMEGYKQAPQEITQVRSMKAGESVTYKTKGGVIFLGSAGISFAGVNVTSLAQGIWETYVEKVDARQVYVKITQSELNALSVGTSLGLAQIGVQNFKNTDDGFSYLMDMNDVEAAKVYYDLVRGNVAAAQLAAEKLSQKVSLTAPVVQKIETFKRISKGKASTFFFGLPIVLNASTSKSKIESFSTTDIHLDNARVEAQFGIYDLTTVTKAFSSHTTNTRGFYGVRYKGSDLKTGQLREQGEMGQFTWMAQDDKTSMRSYLFSLNQIIAETGLDMAQLRMPEKFVDLGFSNITVNMTLGHENTQRILAKGRSMQKASFVKWSQDRTSWMYARKGNALCTKQLPEGTDCLTALTNETTYAAKKMQAALDKMAANYSNDVEYTKAYAEFGQHALTNQVTLGMAMSLAGDGVQVVFATEGTMFTQVVMNFVSTAQDGELRMVKSNGYDTASYLEPVNKRSRFHGLITSKSIPGLGSP